MEISRSLTVLVGLLLLFGVNGCAQSPATPPPGYIAGSISKSLSGEDRAPFRDNWIYLRRVGDKEGIVLSIPRNGTVNGSPDFNKTDILGTTFRIPLKPGKYELYALRFFYQNGKVEKAFYNKNPFSIPVEIEPNRTTYIGAFTAKGIWNENIFGKKIPASGFFELSDQRVRDLRFILSKRPELDAETVDVALPPIPPELHVFFKPQYGQ